MDFSDCQISHLSYIINQINGSDGPSESIQFVSITPQPTPPFNTLFPITHLFHPL